MVKIERRKLTARELASITSRRPVVRRIAPPETSAPMRAGKSTPFSRETPTQRGGESP
jgi:hypothetical protein